MFGCVERIILQGLGQETAEKQQPSALDFVGQLGLALEEHVKSTGKKVPLFQGINHVVTEFNKTVTVKKWRIDPAKKRIITNLMRCPEEVTTILAEHYDQHKHSCSGTLGLLFNFAQYQCVESLIGFQFDFIFAVELIAFSGCSFAGKQVANMFRVSRHMFFTSVLNQQLTAFK